MNNNYIVQLDMQILHVKMTIEEEEEEHAS